MEIGVNVFAFTETDEGIFLVNRKQVDIDIEVVFDSCGGEVAPASASFKLGATYLSLPKPSRVGHTFLGWFTAAEGGSAITANDRCKTGVTKLYAQWEVYQDPFADAICPSKNLTFFSESEPPWFIDSGTFFTAPGAARSGAISHGGTTSLTATVNGRGTLSFRWRADSEPNFDKLTFIADISPERVSASRAKRGR